MLLIQSTFKCQFNNTQSIYLLLNKIMENHIELIKSPNDIREYQAVLLPNGLKVVLIHDNLLQKSACSISVGVGSLEDTDKSLGLAHFLEHMLFMGSEKFPKHNQYSSFISLNSGSDNAYTSDQETNYYFEVGNSVFPEALERLCQFFTSALLTSECISKERQAVHEEYVLATNDDNSRKWEIVRKLAKGPYSRFSYGNNQTLGDTHVREDLVKFYKQHYSSNIINAVMASSLPIKEMKQNLLKFLQQIPNKNHPGFKYDLPFPKGSMGKLVEMESIKEETIMQFFWAIEHLRPKYKEHAGDYICHVLGHQGNNSLLNTLKNKKFASSITAYQHDLMSQTLIGLQIKLTQDGEDKFEQVYNIVIDYVGSLKPIQYIYDQIRQKAEIDFKFKQKRQTSGYVCSLSSKMHTIPISEILNFKSLFNEFDEKSLSSIFAQLNPFNLIVVLSSSQPIQNPITQKYLGAKYIVKNLPQRKNSKQNFTDLSINPFLPLSTQVIDKAPLITNPRMIRKYLYFEQDTQFKVCRGGVKLIVYGKQTYAFLNFYNEYLQLLLKPMSYDAEALGVEISYSGEQTLQIQLFGFNDTVKKLIRQIAQNLLSCHKNKDSKTLFEIAKADYLEDLDNFYSEQVNEIASDTQDLLLMKDRPSIEEITKQLQQYNYQDIIKRINKFWSSSQFQWVIIGNFTQTEAIEIVDHFQSKIPKIESQQIKYNGWIRLTEPSIIYQILLQEEEISTSCATVYFQAGLYSEKTYYILTLLKNHIDEPFFNQLRTEKQLAYYLAVFVEENDGILGLKFLLVSSTKDPGYISNQIKNFVRSFFGKMEKDLTEQKITQLKNSVKTKFIAPHNNLKRKFQFICNEVSSRTHYFDRKTPQNVQKQLSKINKQDLISCAQNLLQKSFQVLVASVPHQAEYKNTKQACTFKQIKQKSQFYQDFAGKLDFSFKNI